MLISRYMQTSISTTGRLRLTSIPDLEPGVFIGSVGSRLVPGCSKPARADSTLSRYCVFQAGRLCF